MTDVAAAVARLRGEVAAAQETDPPHRGDRCAQGGCPCDATLKLEERAPDYATGYADMAEALEKVDGYIQCPHGRYTHACGVEDAARSVDAALAEFVRVAGGAK